MAKLMENSRAKRVAMLGISTEKIDRMDEVDNALTEHNIYVSLDSLIRYVIKGEGDPNEIAEGWAGAIAEDFHE
jgi:hypothetical protein